MADIIGAIALACGLTSELSKSYIDGVRDTVLASLGGVDDRLDLIPTYEELKRMAQYSLIGEGGADHTVTAKDFEPNARYRIVAATNSPKIELGFYEAHYGDTWTETISLQGQEAQLGYYTVEILGLDTAGSTGGVRLLLRYEVNGEPQTIYVDPPSGYSVDVELRTATFTGVESVYRYKPGMEVVAKNGTSIFVRYSANADGTGFTEAWSEGQNYMGIATAYEAPADKGEYSWIRLGTHYELTADDKEEIADMAATKIKAGGVIGVLDDDNNIILSGTLADGTYTLKYENEDGTQTDIGTLDVSEKVEEVNYFDASTALINHRLGSAGTPSSYNGIVVTDFIPWEDAMSGKNFMISGVSACKNSNYGYYVRTVFYDASKNKVSEENDSDGYSYGYGIPTTCGAYVGGGFVRIALVIKDQVAITSADVANIKLTLE